MGTAARHFALFLAGALFVSIVMNTASAQQPDRWRAWAVTEGEDARLVVEGILAEGAPGSIAVLEPARPQGINPKMLMLKLRMVSLPGVWPAVIQPIPAHFTLPRYREGQYSSVQILYPNGESQVVGKITEVTNLDAGSEKPMPQDPGVLVPMIVDVQYRVQTSDPPNLVVVATGEVNTGGYGPTKLIRRKYVKPPQDGIQDYYLRSVPPEGIVTQVISKVSATNQWKDFRSDAPWIKGIRVHGKGDSVVEKVFGE